MVRYRMQGRDVDSNPTQFRAWVANTPDLTGQQYSGLKSGSNPFVDIAVYSIFDDSVIADFNLPMGDVWLSARKTLPAPVSDSQVAIIDGYAYLFGGNLSDKIYQANLNNPADWVDTGARLPTPLYGSQLAIVGSNIYLFGGNDGYSITDKIYSASVSNPLTWTNHGHLLPHPTQYSALGMVNGNLYLFGGEGQGGATAAILTATTSNPLIWTDSGHTLPTPLFGSQVAQLDGYWVLMGGLTSPTSPTANIALTPIANPYAWVVDGYLPHPTAFGQFFTVGSSGFLVAPMIGATFTGFTPIVSYTGDDFLHFADHQMTLPGVVSSSQVAVIGDRMWLWGGNAESAIFMCDQALRFDYYDHVAASYGHNTRTVLQATDNANNPFQAIGIPWWKTSYTL